MKPETYAAICQAIDKAIADTRAPHYAAFDADGTLWNMDMGEALFQYEIDHKLLPLPPHPMQHYHSMKTTVSYPAAYLWLAQIHKGLAVSKVREWATAAVAAHAPLPIFPSQQNLINYLVERGVKVFIVTASIKWAVEPGAPFFGLTHDSVIGIRTGVDAAGLITDQQEGPITWRAGKVEGLLQATGGVAPIFASGNTEGDLALLECASHVRLVMAANTSENENHPTERRLLKIAAERGWFAQDYVGG